MNQQELLKKARQLEKEMRETQQTINETEFKTVCGPVVVIMLGNKTIKSIKIEDGFSIEDAEDKSILEDSIVAASAKLIEEIDSYTEEEMSKYTAFFGGMGGF